MHHLIGHRTFAALEARNTEEEERRHEAALRLEFTILVPSAGRLRVSELILQRHHTDEGCKLEYYLVLPPQITLDLEGRGDPDTPNETDLRAFEQDVANVTAECTSVKTRLVLAQSPALGHRELQQESQATLDLKRLRGLFSRRKKTVVLPTPTGDLLIELPPAPAKLPTAVECGAQALVEKMLPDEVARLAGLPRAHHAPLCLFDKSPNPDLLPGVLLANLAKDECIGDLTNDKDELTQGVLAEDLRDGHAEKKIALDALVLGARAALIRLKTFSEGQQSMATGSMKMQWEAVERELSATVQRSKSLQTDEAYKLALAADSVISDGWRQYRSRPEVPLNLQRGTVQLWCAIEDAPDKCDQFESRVRMWRVVTLTAAIHHRLQGLANDERMRAYDILLRRWSAYRSNALHQTFWELAWNGSRMNSDPNVCPRDKTGQRIGLCKVPQTQMILGHPDVGLRLSRNANNSSELKPYLVVELIGRNTFTWLRDDTDTKAKLEDMATIDRQFGYSLAAAYGYERDRNRWAIGPMVHWNGYNMAITRSTSGHWALTINTTLSNAFFEKREAVAAKFQNLGLKALAE